MRIHVITTGGSLDVEYTLQGTFAIGPPVVASLLERARTRHEITVESLCRKPFNLGLAVAALQTLPHGVHIAMSGRIFPAGHARKDRARGSSSDPAT
ncbi:hypothetical protein C8D87_103652 [Lentzea atacamensis]|uniref:Uncharacterized protein n=1 Tax=Lentzea atacamensis TaxID=531938 RepID=A0ABX9EBF6_9PSEU|nr:hypothetical protein [Lentzea atacamensis]RAS67313.1 hypothetical protein C8D87_103652 [Lentzea atacamensis]